jgi:hypothetical protein
MTREARFQVEAEALGYNFDGEIKIGGNYVPIMRDENQFMSADKSHALATQSSLRALQVMMWH